MLNVKQYTTTPELVTAIIVTKENIKEVAEYCGGRVIEEVNETHLLVPTLEGNLKIAMGSFIVRDGNSGGFFNMSEVDFKNKYRQVGLRNGSLSVRP